MKPSGILCAVILIVASLHGCGGGGGGGGTVAPPPAPPAVMPTPPPAPPEMMPKAALEPSAQAAQAPLFGFDGSLQIGMGAAPPAEELQKMGSRNGVEVSQGSVRDGSVAADVIAYLRPRAIHPEVTGLATFPNPPTVHVVEGTSEKYTGYAVRAVQIVNAALPRDARLSFGDTPAPDPAGVEDVPRGGIHIEFIPQSQWPEEDDMDQSAVGNTKSQIFYNPRTQRNEVVEAGSSHILIDSGEVQNFPEEKTVYVIVHELLHALGFSGHTDPARFPDATLNPNVPANLPRFLLSKIDRDALLAAYARFRPGALPEEISAQSLGPWDETSLHVRGDLGIPGGEVSFGAAFRNGLAQPWATGPEPPMDLAQNPELSGTATWSGALLGVTPSGEVVVGDAGLGVDLANLDGQLDFTDVQFDGGGMWGDGDLGYSIEVRGNVFTRSGGDAGVVTGAFFGARHEGMGGVLERSDLSAGFGGKR
ncbi:MAG: hypothetical protein OXG62_09830 [Nitrospinae bacterium]|nr:hypothetical protein [Nitrospinota bacterium]